MDNIKVTQNANKLTFLAKEYPKKDIAELASLFEISPIDFNAATWHAEDSKFLNVNQKTGKVKIKYFPTQWDFGADIEYLIKVIPYVFGKLAESKADMEENYLNNNARGYASQDVLIAMRWLLTRKIMASYVIEDVSKDEKGKEQVEKYTFYTLNENFGKQWGKKQFKNKKQLKK